MRIVSWNEGRNVWVIWGEIYTKKRESRKDKDRDRDGDISTYIG